jgi:2-C-methyl-D-erythritol 4-phosphate cytidylyltransferase
MGMKRYAIIVAGGSGSRMGGDVAKQFLELDGKPVIEHTVRRFLEMKQVPEIVLVLPSAYKEYWKEHCFRNNLMFRHTLASGGITRFHSVRNAVRYLERDGVVAVHDGVRPFVSTSFLEEMYREGEKKGAVIPVVKPADSVRVYTNKESGESSPEDRDKFLLVQTPQVFHTDILIDGYAQAYDPSFTDDASVAAGVGAKIHLAQGKVTNIKLTNPDDMVLAESLMRASVFSDS